MRKLHFIQASPVDPMFWWQTAVQLYNFRKYGYDKQARVLVFIDRYQIDNHPEDKWATLQQKFPNTKFSFYYDHHNLWRTIQKGNYVPLLRPYCLDKHFKEFPELKEAAIFYHDSDIIFSKRLEIDKYIDDDINYLSYTGRREDQYNYQCYSHFTDKEKNIRDDKLDEYLKLDPIKRILGSFGITVQDFIERKGQVGGAQYLLKNIDYKFWQNVLEECVNIRTYLQKVNQHFMVGENYKEREDNGFQSWAADMWAIQWLLWKDKKQTVCPEEMDFSWATDKIDRWEKHAIYHDAGVQDNRWYKEGENYYTLFSKRGRTQWVQESDGLKAYCSYTHPWDHPLLEIPFGEDFSNVDKKYCSINYVKELKEAQEFLNL